MPTLIELATHLEDGGTIELANKEKYQLGTDNWLHPIGQGQSLSYVPLSAKIVKKWFHYLDGSIENGIPCYVSDFKDSPYSHCEVKMVVSYNGDSAYPFKTYNGYGWRYATPIFRQEK